MKRHTAPRARSCSSARNIAVIRSIMTGAAVPTWQAQHVGGGRADREGSATPRGGIFTRAHRENWFEGAVGWALASHLRFPSVQRGKDLHVETFISLTRQWLVQGLLDCPSCAFRSKSQWVLTVRVTSAQSYISCVAASNARYAKTRAVFCSWLPARIMDTLSSTVSDLGR